MLFASPAPSPFALMAPREFNQRLRRTVDKNMVCWWEPEASRKLMKRDGTWQTVKGCWVVFIKARFQQFLGGHAVDIGMAKDAYVDVFHLNGENSLPTGLGSWVFHALRASDVTRRGNHDRNRQLNDADERHVMERYELDTQFSEEWANDPVVAKTHKRVAEEVGAPSVSAEDAKAKVKEYEKLERAMYEKVLQRAKNARTHREAM